MFLSAYRFQGDPPTLLAAHRRLLETIPGDNLHLHACVTQADGVTMFDACPSRAVFEKFSAGDEFRQMLAAAGLPFPQITPLGELTTVLAQGRRLV
jgi:hypothetical protein